MSAPFVIRTTLINKHQDQTCLVPVPLQRKQILVDSISEYKGIGKVLLQLDSWHRWIDDSNIDGQSVARISSHRQRDHLISTVGTARRAGHVPRFKYGTSTNTRQHFQYGNGTVLVPNKCTRHITYFMLFS